MWSQLALLLLLVGYWLYVLSLERVVLIQAPPGLWQWFVARTPLLDLFTPLILWPYKLFGWHVLRHFIPVLVGWRFAYSATLSLLQTLYGLPDRLAAASLLRRLGGFIPFGPPTLIRRNSFQEDRLAEPLLRIGGPGRVHVAAGEAVVTERNGRFHRVLSPGMHMLGRFEYPVAVLDLRQQEREDKEAKMVTSDGIELTAEVSVTFQIGRTDNPPTMSQPYPFDPKAARQAAYAVTNLGDGKTSGWEALALIITSSQLKDVVAEYRLDELIFPDQAASDPHQTVKMEMERRARTVMRNFGVDIVSTRLGRLEMPDPVTEQHIQYWQAFWDKQRHLSQADGAAKALEEAEVARAEAEAMMIQAIVEGIQRARQQGKMGTLREILALRLIEALESMAQQSEEVLPVAGRLLPRLGVLRQELLLNREPIQESTDS
ncbi:MAG: SPFH domain-containing protein [Chloroflexi bacterium]|nr:SPFH domain-containing protein [Chloroflexota bacterium]MCI0649162.1 SPFH domain-containing protein [Chloroflexota bacterium]